MFKTEQHDILISLQPKMNIILLFHLLFSLFLLNSIRAFFCPFVWNKIKKMMSCLSILALEINWMCKISIWAEIPIFKCLFIGFSQRTRFDIQTFQKNSRNVWSLFHSNPIQKKNRRIRVFSRLLQSSESRASERRYVAGRVFFNHIDKKISPNFQQFHRAKEKSIYRQHTDHSCKPIILVDFVDDGHFYLLSCSKH